MTNFSRSVLNIVASIPKRGYSLTKKLLFELDRHMLFDRLEQFSRKIPLEIYRATELSKAMDPSDLTTDLFKTARRIFLLMKVFVLKNNFICIYEKRSVKAPFGAFTTRITYIRS